MKPMKRSIKSSLSSSESGRRFSLESPKLSSASFKKSVDFSKAAGKTPKKSSIPDSDSIEMAVGLTDEELMRMDIKDLNDYLRRLPKNAAATARRRRRLLKNRGYAQSTRTKRMTTIEECSARKSELRGEIDSMKREVDRLRGVRERLRMTRSRLERTQSNGGAYPVTSNEILVNPAEMEDSKAWFM